MVIVRSLAQPCAFNTLEGSIDERNICTQLQSFADILKRPELAKKVRVINIRAGNHEDATKLAQLLHSILPKTQSPRVLGISGFRIILESLHTTALDHSIYSFLIPGFHKAKLSPVCTSYALHGTYTASLCHGLILLSRGDRKLLIPFKRCTARFTISS